MSQENVEVVQRAWEAWTRRDLDGLLEHCDPSVEWDTRSFEGWPSPDVHRGHDAFREFLDAWLDTWERFEAGADDYVDVDADRVIVLCWQQGYGAGSHVPVRMDYAVVCTLDRGVVTRMLAYSDRQEALAAVGSSPELR
jgi:ketosteroid isomerase-like protein